MFRVTELSMLLSKLLVILLLLCRRMPARLLEWYGRDVACKPLLRALTEAVRQVRMEEYLEDLSEEAHVLIQEPEARAEAMHSAQHQSMVCVILGFLP